MKEIFATGVISDKTPRRVKIDREQRISAGKPPMPPHERAFEREVYRNL